MLRTCGIILCVRKNTKVFKKSMLSLDLVWFKSGLSLDLVWTSSLRLLARCRAYPPE